MNSNLFENLNNPNLWSPITVIGDQRSGLLSFLNGFEFIEYLQLNLKQ